MSIDLTQDFVRTLNSEPGTRTLNPECDTLKQNYEILFVDDGSNDKTFKALEDIHNTDGRVKVIRFRKNYGQTAAMSAGFRMARGKVIVSMDGDLQNDPIGFKKQDVYSS